MTAKHLFQAFPQGSQSNEKIDLMFYFKLMHPGATERTCVIRTAFPAPLLVAEVCSVPNRRDMWFRMRA